MGSRNLNGPRVMTWLYSPATSRCFYSVISFFSLCSLLVTFGLTSACALIITTLISFSGEPLDYKSLIPGLGPLVLKCWPLHSPQSFCVFVLCFLLSPFLSLFTLGLIAFRCVFFFVSRRLSLRCHMLNCGQGIDPLTIVKLVVFTEIDLIHSRVFSHSWQSFSFM